MTGTLPSASTSIAAPRPPAAPRPWLAVQTLVVREWVRFVRQRNRVVGAVGQPLIFWLLFGAGLGPSFRMPGAADGSISYREYFFPGSLVLILLFTAIFSTISIIEDRREGFLQSVLVAPLPRWSLVLGKVLGGTLLALAQGVLFLALGWLVGMPVSLLAAIEAAALMFVMALGLTALGFVIAWRMDSTQGFHAIMSVFLMPMWLLSGAFFPVPTWDAAVGWGQRLLAGVMWANPLTYGVAALRNLLFAGTAPDALGPFAPSLFVGWLVTLLFAGLMFLAAWKLQSSARPEICYEQLGRANVVAGRFLSGDGLWRLDFLPADAGLAADGHRAAGSGEHLDASRRADCRLHAQRSNRSGVWHARAARSCMGGQLLLRQLPRHVQTTQPALASLNDQVPQDVRLVSVTCDPENDTPEALASYSQTFGADPARWKFLTGDMADLQRVGQDIFQVVLAQGTHSERAFVVDRAGRVRGRFSVLDPVEVKKLARLVNELDQQPAPTGASDPAAEVTATENSDSAEAGQPAQATKTGTAEFGGADPDAATSGAADSSGPATEPAGAR